MRTTAAAPSLRPQHRLHRRTATAPHQVVPPVSDWNVRRVPLHRESRHKDVNAMMDMFKQLDLFLAAQRSQLQH